MSVSARYILAAMAFAFAPVAAYADCAGCNGGSVLPGNPAVNVPGPVVGNPNFSSGPAPGAPRNGCGSACTPGLPTGPTIVVPQPFVPAPNIVTHNPGFSQYGGTTITTTVVGDTYVYARGHGGGGGVFAAGVDGGAGMTYDQGPEQRSATRQVERLVAIQAICIDDRGMPHPASQTFGEQDIPTGYTGEIFRCIAGTAMRVTLGQHGVQGASFEGGRVFDCQKGEALVYRDGTVVCATQEQRRQCNERSLLRRFGPGIKVVRITTTESYTSVVERRGQVTAPTAMFDGGVGQAVWQ